MHVYENMCFVSGSGGDWGGVQFMVKHHDKEGSDKGESKDDTCSSSEITEAWFSTFSLQLLEAVLKMSCG